MRGRSLYCHCCCRFGDDNWLVLELEFVPGGPLLWLGFAGVCWTKRPTAHCDVSTCSYILSKSAAPKCEMNTSRMPNALFINNISFASSSTHFSIHECFDCDVEETIKMNSKIERRLVQLGCGERAIPRERGEGFIVVSLSRYLLHASPYDDGQIVLRCVAHCFGNLSTRRRRIYFGKFVARSPFCIPRGWFVAQSRKSLAFAVQVLRGQGERQPCLQSSSQ